jgi:hypothetical protein
MTILRKLIQACGLMALASAATVGPAAAAPLEHEHFHDVSSEVIEEFCGDLTVREDVDITGVLLGNAHGRDGLIYFSERLHGTVSWTNLANGKSFTAVFNQISKDLKVTDNGDGTLTILVMSTGGTRLYGPDDKVVLRDPGQIRFAFLIDHGGTPADPTDDVFLEDLGLVKGSTGRNDTEGRDFCADIHEFIG